MVQPIDEQLGYDLVAQLKVITGNRIRDIMFTWDAYHRSDVHKHERLYITPNRIVHELLTRNSWLRISTMNFVFIAPATINVENGREVSEWVYHWDNLVEDIKSVIPLNRPLQAFEQEERFSIVELQSRARLMFEATGTYNLKV